MPIASQHATSHRALGAAAVVLLIFAFLPVRYGHWVNGLRPVPELVIAPSRWVFSGLTRLIVRPAREADAEQLRALESDRDHWKTQALAAQQRVRELSHLLEQEHAGLLQPEPGIKLSRVRVSGPDGPPGTQMLSLGAGSRHGLARGVVAVTDRVQVVGRLERVGAASSTVVLITQAEQPPLGGALIFEGPAAGQTTELLTQLFAQRDGTLRGQVEYKPVDPGAPAREPRVGQTVYLNDKSWPESARMLVIGKVTEARPVLDSPLRQLITVKPTVLLDRLTEVTVRVPLDAPAGPGGGP